ncbi:MAG: Cys-tRNA(Pro) deacylase [Ruminococcus sp.]
MAKKQEKTNVMRILDQKKIEYSHFAYDNTKLNAEEVANCLGQSVEKVFKTLVTVGKSGEHYVFVVPANRELDLKKAAKCAGEKSIEMIPQRELLPLTGYIHGGCSPIGMKKQFKTFIHTTAQDFDNFYFSAGRVGSQVSTSLSSLQRVIDVVPADIIKENS